MVIFFILCKGENKLRTYTWDEYYEKFYDWAESTRIRHLSDLTSLGDADEVAEVIIELQENIKASNRLLERAVKEKLAFSGNDLTEFLYANDGKLVLAALNNSIQRFTQEDIEDLYCSFDDEIITKICKQRKLALPKDLQEEIELDKQFEQEVVYEKPKKTGFFASLLILFGIGQLFRKRNTSSHPGRCSGDCAHCPPHYGYRYGRWYYGKGHTHGCEFGGNKADGSL